MWDLTYALNEEIGDPDLFVGRKSEMADLLDWAEGTKRRVSKSMGILSRRKKGKTALLQRFFNILYDRNDPLLLPHPRGKPLQDVVREEVLQASAQSVLRLHHPDARTGRKVPPVERAQRVGRL